jgi:hypothetical protein
MAIRQQTAEGEEGRGRGTLTLSLKERGGRMSVPFFWSPPC